jgi:Ca-activated chloride channel family protein
MLAAGIGKPDLIESGDLDKAEVLSTVRSLLRGVERSSGSSGWLADLYRDGERTGAHYEAMWNYEAVIKETNDKLTASGIAPLYAIYPEDGASIGDSPLGFVDRGRGREVEGFSQTFGPSCSRARRRHASQRPGDGSSLGAPRRSMPTR